jgi:hypothetical protein
MKDADLKTIFQETLFTKGGARRKRFTSQEVDNLRRLFQAENFVQLSASQEQQLKELMAEKGL